MKIENFKSYGDKDNQIDFKNINVACIVGKNGNGKSSIAEAIAWALFGQFERLQTGNRAKFSEIEYINSKKDYMQVEFDFELNKTIYKVVRRLEKREKNNKQLAIFIKNGDNLIPISEATYTQTQKKLERILGIDFNIFLHSAYLSQKRTEDFLLSSPEQRREILGRILNLDIYDMVNEFAKEKRKEFRFELESIQRQIELKNQVISEEEAVMGYLADLEEKKNQTSKELEILRNEYQVFLNEKYKTEQDIRILEQKIKEREELLKQQKDLKSKIESHEKELNKIQLDIKDEQEVILKVNEFKILQKEMENLTQVNNTYIELNNNLAILEKQLESKNQQKKIYEASIKDKENQIERDNLEISNWQKALKDTEDKLKLIQENLNHLNNQKDLYEEKKNKLIQIEKSLSIVKSKIKELRENYRRIDKNEGKCPVCLREIKSENEKEHIKNEITNQGLKLKSIEKTLNGELSIIKKEIEQLQNQINQEDMVRKQERELSNMCERLKANIDQKTKSIEQLKKSILQDNQNLKQCTEDVKEFENNIVELKNKISSLNFDKGSFSSLQAKIKELEKYQERLNKINISKTRAEALKQNIDEFNKSLQKLDDQMRKYEEDIKNFDQEGLAYKKLELERKLIEIEKRIKIHESSLNDIIKELGINEQKINAINLAKDEILRLTQEKEKLSKKIQVYDIIIDTTGPDGIKNEIIANTLPIIKDEANRLLKTLTNGNFSVDFKTQKETGSGKIIETLQIEISDSNGSRNYELFSGGELFRINFAIRIALSKVLLKRAGASIRMLIMDEGFGSQDEDGKDHIIECINHIKNQFDTILVITHIEDLMDAFEQKIIVKKDVEGSKIYVV